MMTNPTPYDPLYSYTGFSVGQGNNSFPGPQIDADFAALNLTTDQTITALADVRRSDGALVNEIVTIDSLSPEVLGLLSDGATGAGSATAPIYSTVVGMAAVNLPAETTAIRTNGYSTVGDGQGGLFTTANTGSTDTFVSADGRTWYRSSDGYSPNTTRSDGGGTVATVIQPTNSVLDQRTSLWDVIPPAIQKQIRAGTYTGDCAPYFQAIATLIYVGGTNRQGRGKVYIPGGKYLINSSIPLMSGIEWEGEAKENTRIQATGNFPVFKSVGTAATPVGRCAVRNVTIIGVDSTQLYGYGIELIRMNNAVVDNVQFRTLRWCITQEYCINVFITNCTSDGAASSIRGYFWAKAVDSVNYAGYDNTTVMSDCYFMGGVIGLLLHGSNGIQMGGNVNMLQVTNRIGAHAETLPDGTSFTPGALNDPVHFIHLDGFHTDSTTSAGAPALYMIKGSMPALEDIRITSMWGGNITGSTGVNGTIIAADGVTDLVISGCMADTMGRFFVSLNNCDKVAITGCSARKYGGGASGAAVIATGCTRVTLTGNNFQRHASNAAPEGARFNTCSRVTVTGNNFNTDIGSGVILSATTKSTVIGNTFDDGVAPAVEGGAANFNRIIGNICTVAATVVGANTVAANN